MKQTDFEHEISRLTTAIESVPNDFSLYMERAKLFHSHGIFDKALNDFIHISDNDATLRDEAETYIVILREIFEYRYTDIYNP